MNEYELISIIELVLIPYKYENIRYNFYRYNFYLQMSLIIKISN